jgi:hypothetical protein
VDLFFKHKGDLVGHKLGERFDVLWAVVDVLEVSNVDYQLGVTRYFPLIFVDINLIITQLLILHMVIFVDVLARRVVLAAIVRCMRHCIAQLALTILLLKCHPALIHLVPV